MYNVVVFKKNMPHDEENFICGFYSEELENVNEFLESVNFEVCEAVIEQLEENEKNIN